MRKTIIPSIIAENQKDLTKKINSFKNNSSIVQLDIMDGKFLKNKSLWPNFKLPKTNLKYEAHLMVFNPNSWIKKNYKKINLIIFHIESVKNPLATINLIKSKKKKVGIVINPKTSISSIISLLDKIDHVTIMTVTPGKYGSKFLPKTLDKVKALRKINSKIDIEVDGGINNKTIKLARKAGANKFISGSYLQKSASITQGLRTLRELIR